MLHVRALRAGYGGVPVLHGVDLDVARNEAIAIVGPNGAGKTTLVRVLSGLLFPISGSVRKEGIEISRIPPHRRVEHGIAAVLEGRNLFSELSVRDHLRLAESMGRRATHDNARFDIDEIFDLFPMVKEKYETPVELLSGGQQQMVTISRALLLQPTLLILDELTTGLAPKVVKEILTVLNRLRERGMSTILVEQSITLAAEMTDRTYVVSVGRVVREISRDEWPCLLADGELMKTYLHG
ncbi:MAG: ABC transporter ATP-binding protein [Burkholderiaceae bacterium]|nr:ABC transporter ATP-binding protein [Burkholderiaceae bacterium]